MLKTVTNSINASQIQTPITLPGDVTLSTGNLVIGTSGKGIDFSATPGTGTSELLADYEEGTWTPTLGVYAGAFGSVTTSGTYTKVGRLVTLDFTFTIVAAGTAVGVIVISGQPFSSTAGSTAGSIAETSNLVSGLIYPSGTSSFTVAKYDGNSPIATGNIWAGSITYRV
jgi:hypothetical protein